MTNVSVHYGGMLVGLRSIPHGVENVRAAQPPVAAEDDRLDLAELRDPLDDREGARGHPATHVHLEPHRDVVAGEVLALAQGPADPERTVQEPHPQGGGGHSEHEAEADRI